MKVCSGAMPYLYIEVIGEGGREKKGGEVKNGKQEKKGDLASSGTFSYSPCDNGDNDGASFFPVRHCRSRHRKTNFGSRRIHERHRHNYKITLPNHYLWTRIFPLGGA